MPDEAGAQLQGGLTEAQKRENVIRLAFGGNEFFVPGVHSRPLSDEDPDIAPDLIPLRETLSDHFPLLAELEV